MTLGISRDPLANHARLAEMLGVRIPLLSDVDGNVGGLYALTPENAWAGPNYSYEVSPCVFVIDRKGVVRHRHTPDVLVSPDHPVPAVVQKALDDRSARKGGQTSFMYTSTLLRALQAINEEG
jgi:peroxiredoxin